MQLLRARSSSSLWSLFALITFIGAAFIESATAAQTLVPIGSVWRYKADGSDQGSTWSSPSFDPVGWVGGRAPLGFGDPHIVTTLPSGFVTYYFRRDFLVANAASISSLALRLLRDDGAVVYLNGVEVRRDNMPAGPVTFNTLATTAVGGPDEMTYFESTLPPSLLMNGTNILAVEVHQNATISSDLGFDAELVANGGNTPPVALNASVSINKNEMIAITLYGTDAENNMLSYSIVTGPTHGQLTGTPPQVTYAPASDYVGSDSFTFKVNDGQADSAPATVSIQILDPNPSGELIRRGDNWKYFDVGIDPGGTWMNPGFDDSAWPASNAEFGFGDGDEVTVINRIDPNGQFLITAYFRKTFSVANTSAFSSVALDLWRDDGAIVYLNGVEVLRNNMPPGPATYSTFASTTPVDDGFNPVRATFPSSFLVNGANVIAVEVHQVNVTSSDLSFDLALTVGNTPTNQAPVANNQTVTVQANTGTPIMLTGSDADGDELRFILVSTPTRGTLSGSLPNLIYTPNPGYTGPDSFQFRVNDGTLNSPAATISIEVEGTSTALIPRGAVWKYFDLGMYPGADWINAVYDEAFWSSGPAELGFGDLDEATVIHSTASDGSRLITAYFRHRFNVASPNAIGGLSLQLWRDDGAIVYLNGVEILRNNMPDGPVDYSTFSAAIASDDGDVPVTIDLSPSLLLAGENLIAVEVHQQTPVSSDISFDLALGTVGEPPNNPPVANSQSVTVQANTPTPITLSGSDADGDPLSYIVAPPVHGTLSGTPPNITYTPDANYVGADSFQFSVNDGKADSALATVSITIQAPPGESLIAAGSVWKYFDTGSFPGSTWKQPGFNDTAWRSGPAELGFGDGDEATVIRSTNVFGPLITAYFRRTFNVTDPSAVGGLSLQLWRDDGAVVYLNGIEVFRNNMPVGPVTQTNLALSAAPDDGNSPVTAELSSSLLVAGANLIAVEVHQNNRLSTDLSFDLQLDATEAPPNQPPVANNQALTMFQDSSVAITLTGSDPDGDPLTYTVATFPAHGTLSGAAPHMAYSPAPGYIGADSFTFTVGDGQASSAPATVSIQVLRQPDPPEVVSAVLVCGTANVHITFNEALDPQYAEDTFNYWLEGTDATIIPAVEIVSRPSAYEVIVRLDSMPTRGQDYTLWVYYMCDPDGDCAQMQSVPLQIDAVPPIVACDIGVNTLSPPNNALVNIGLIAAASEGVIEVKVFSDEPELSVLDDAVFSNGALKLRARRNPTQDGRVYLVVVSSTDACGNTAVCCRTVVVPANGSQAALHAVNTQAAAAQSQCSPNGAPSTPYRLRMPITAPVGSGSLQGTTRLIESVIGSGIDRKRERTLCAALEAAAASFEAGREDAAVNQLRAFQHKVRTQFSGSDPEFGDALIQAAQDIIDGGW